MARGLNASGWAARGVGAALLTLIATQAMALPARVIVLRHGEKQDAERLCAVGRERAQALAAQHLGREATASVFRPGETPKAFFAITLHTLETIAPTAASWAQPVITYAVLPGSSGAIDDDALDTRTRQLVQDLRTDPRWDGATVVVTWEHAHIAKTVSRHPHKLPQDKEKAAEKAAAKSEEQIEQSMARAQARPELPSTLYELWGLSRFPNAPSNWPGETYDYFWIIDFDQKTGQPSAFQSVKQLYGAPYAGVPQNDWGMPNGLLAASGCQL